MTNKDTKWIVQDKISKRYFSYHPNNYNGKFGGPGQFREKSSKEATNFSELFENVAEGCLAELPKMVCRIPDSENIKHVPEPQWVKVKSVITYTVMAE